jgi:putative membrane-bound dehydrogenase-like protein
MFNPTPQFLRILTSTFFYAFFACTTLAQAQETTIDTISVPDGFVVEKVADSSLTAYPMFMTFDDQGRLYIAESTGKDLGGQEMIDAPECQILRLVDTNGDGKYDERTVYADTISLPMGLLWHQGSLFVTGPPQFYRFKDTDDDGVADEREILLEGWNFKNTASLHGPYLGPDGRLYLTHGRHGYSIKTKEGTTLEGTAARIWRCWPDGTELERFAGGGFDNPVELTFLDSTEIIGTMTYFTDPKYGQRDALMHWVWGGAYPKNGDVVSELIRTSHELMPTMSKFSRIAPAGLELYRSSGFGEEYEKSLFSAQFNPHRVQHHKIIRDGATFRTEDQDFLTSSNPDFYPTDVLEDADGSLLVCDTGAWYVDACPVSRVSKPEVKGSIYRVRKIEAPTIDDPWGAQLNWDKLNDQALVKLLSDTRPRVNDRALNALIKHGASAVDTLGNTLGTDPNPRARLLALTALRQIKGGSSRARHIRTGLDDASLDVRLAAAQAVGDLKDVPSTDKLIRLLHSPTPAEQRAAATALGHIGNPKATAQLLMAASKPMDRFTEHAVIYALIELNSLNLVHAQLEGSKASPAGKAALIVLDQLKYANLKASHVIPFLDSKDTELRKTGLWVASHHTDWAPEVLAFVEQGLRAETFTREDSAGTEEVLLAYSSSADSQKLIATLMTEDTSSTELRLFLINVINNTQLSTFPESWNAGIEASLQSKEADVRWAAIELIRSRNLATFDKTLQAMTANDAETSRFRLGALAALAMRTPQLNEAQVQLLLASLNKADDPTLRQSAARLLTAVTLSANDKLQLATEFLPKADALVLGSMLDVFSGETDEKLGDAIIASLLENKTFADVINPGLFSSSLEGFSPAIQEKAKPLHEQLQKGNEELLKRFTKIEKELGSGDVGRGRRVFFGEVSACSTCHAIGTDGGTLGPDLTTIGEVRTGHDLLEAIVFPNSSFVPEFTPYMVETNDDLYVGLINRETSEGITIKTGVGEERYIPRKDILDITASNMSIMPEGLDAALSDQELLDLVTFLQSLDGNNFLLPNSEK